MGQQQHCEERHADACTEGSSKTGVDAKRQAGRVQIAYAIPVQARVFDPERASAGNGESRRRAIDRLSHDDTPRRGVL